MLQLLWLLDRGTGEEERGCCATVPMELQEPSGAGCQDDWILNRLAIQFRQAILLLNVSARHEEPSIYHPTAGS